MYSPVSNKRIALISGDGAPDVLLATGDDSQAWAEVSEANARLIAAAPELLSTLEKCAAVMRRASQAKWTRAFEDEYCEADQQARAALSKARAP